MAATSGGKSSQSWTEVDRRGTHDCYDVVSWVARRFVATVAAFVGGMPFWGRQARTPQQISTTKAAHYDMRYKYPK